MNCRGDIFTLFLKELGCSSCEWPSRYEMTRCTCILIKGAWNDQSCAINEFPSTFESAAATFLTFPPLYILSFFSKWQHNSHLQSYQLSFHFYCANCFFSIWNWPTNPCLVQELHSAVVLLCCFVLLHNKINPKIVYN